MLNKVAPQLHPNPVVAPWHHIGIDFIGPISTQSTKGNCYILTISYYFSKWAEALPTGSKHAVVVATALFKVKLFILNSKL